MRYYKNNWKRIFLGPDNGGGSGGGSSANPAANQAGGGANDGSSSAFVDPTAGIDLDDLTPEVRAVVEASRKGFASLQEQATRAEQARQEEEKRRKDFQSNYDKLRVQVQGLNGGNGGSNGNIDPAEVELQGLTEILVAEGVDAKYAPAQARILQKAMSHVGKSIKQEIGKDLHPFATTIVEREAQFAWDQAIATDNTGALQIPELAQEVWDQVQAMAKAGQQVTTPIVERLTGMAYFARMQKGILPAGGNPNPSVNQQQQQQLPSVGRLTYPGAGNNPGRPQPSNGGSILDPATDAALQSVFQTWNKGQGGVKAPGLRVPTKGGK